jgi:Bacterial antitoxin of type II TA system, VapB
MRTTIRLDDDLLKAARQWAIANHTTLTALVEDALRRLLAQRPTETADRFVIHPFGEGGSLPGVDLDDSAALRDLLDGLR